MGYHEGVSSEGPRKGYGTMAHLTSANIHLSGKITPKPATVANEAEIYGRVDLDAKAYSSTVYVENSTQAAQLAEAFATLAAEMADAEQVIAEADAAEALEKTAREQREAAELADADTSDHYPSTEGV